MFINCFLNQTFIDFDQKVRQTWKKSRQMMENFKIHGLENSVNSYRLALLM